MSATGPTGVSMHDLLAACAAAEVVSRPPQRPEETPAEGERPATTAPRAAGDRSTRPRVAA
nr:hypothetical protein [Streptomyces sp. IMTB 2501]